MRRHRTQLGFKRTDGGRREAGFIGHTGDCFVRALSILTNLRYAAIYEAVNEVCRQSPRPFHKKASYAHSGVALGIYKTIMESNGWLYHDFDSRDAPQLHFCREDLPLGDLMVCVKTHKKGEHHIVAVKNHVVHDATNGANLTRFRVIGYFERDRRKKSSKNKKAPKR